MNVTVVTSRDGKELNLKSYFNKPSVASTSRHQVEMPGASTPAQDSSLEREQVEDCLSDIKDSSDTAVSLQPTQDCCCTNPMFHIRHQMFQIQR